METMKKKTSGRSEKATIRSQREEERSAVRKGPWTMEEDFILFNYILNHGEGLWNSVAKASGLKRTGKSCRLRWLNYLRPDVRRGNITAEEQLLIMELHAKLGNRWSKIAKHLPGRTDNEIKNFWRTKIQRHIKVSSENIPSKSHHGSVVTKTTDQGSSSKAMETDESFCPSTTSFHDLDQSNSSNYSWNVEDLWPVHLLNGTDQYHVI